MHFWSCKWQKLTQSSLSKTRNSFHLTWLRNAEANVVGAQQDLRFRMLPCRLPSMLGFLASSLSGHWLHPQVLACSWSFVEPGLLFTHNSTCHTAGELCAYSFLTLPWTICERPWNLSSTEKRGGTQGKLKIYTFMLNKRKPKQLSKCAGQAVTPAAPEGLGQVDWKSLQGKL